MQLTVKWSDSGEETYQHIALYRPHRPRPANAGLLIVTFEGEAELYYYDVTRPREARESIRKKYITDYGRDVERADFYAQVPMHFEA